MKPRWQEGYEPGRNSHPYHPEGYRVRIPGTRSTMPFWALAVALLVVPIGIYAATSWATSRSSFCDSCHEMKPYHAAWETGAHSGDAECVECHVDQGVVPEFAHKFVALKEVWVHFTADPKFPSTRTVDVPNRRCLACHEPRDPSRSRFRHRPHVTEVECQTCHEATGHQVSAKALADAGILRADLSAVDTAAPSEAATASAIARHVAVVCTRCHDLAALACPACHEAPPEHFTGDCTTCHRAGPQWRFVHVAVLDCTRCHKAPAAHFGPKCAGCHSPAVAFADTRYRHVPGGDCPECHAPPKDHYATGCGTCHRAGVSFAFSHPTSKTCERCHRRPASHFAGACSACHTPKVAFARTVFRHPGGRLVCSRCHRTPRNHFGPGCAGCHRVGVAFARAVFRHPGNTGEHSWRSFACVKCHPGNVYSRASCTCHGGRPPSEGEDD